MRPINADKFLQDMADLYRQAGWDEREVHFSLADLRFNISMEDIVPIPRKEPDTVQVIRCRDCEHWDGDDSETFCSELGIFGTGQNSFCSYARKKEEPTMEEFMYGQDLGDPEDGSL